MYRFIQSSSSFSYFRLVNHFNIAEFSEIITAGVTFHTNLILPSLPLFFDSPVSSSVSPNNKGVYAVIFSKLLLYPPRFIPYTSL